MKRERYYYSYPYGCGTAWALLNPEKKVVANSVVGKYSKQFPRLTVCGVFDEDTHTATFGTAVCSPKDLFIKKVGREVSYKRAIETPIKTIHIINVAEFAQEFYKVAAQLEQEHYDKYLGK